MKSRKRAIGNPTRAQQAYQDRARELGCVVCRFRIANGMQKDQPNATRIHHRNVGDYHGQKQLGHDEVVALCDWHHDGWQLERSEEHTSELQSLMRISYAVFCLKKTNYTQPYNHIP